MSRQYYLPSLTVTMTNIELRDWFAGMASDADISDTIQRNAALLNPDTQDQIGLIYKHPTRQEARFMHADAMIAARERKEEK